MWIGQRGIMHMNYVTFKQKISDYVNIMNSTTCCFTGHRPQSLSWGFNESDERCLKMKLQLKYEIVKAIENGYTTFIPGMALGFDTICAETVIELKKKYPNIKLIGAIPCKNQDKLWQKKDKERYKTLLKKLDGTRCIYDEYIGAECMLERNRYMINNSALVIALFNGKNGGTKKTIDYAREHNLKVVILNCD